MARPRAEVLSSISGETLEKARKELNEDPETREEAVAELRAKIEEVEGSHEFEGVTFARKDGKFLLRFLRAKKFDVERATRLYCNYYLYRHQHAELFTDFHPRALEHTLKSGVLGMTKLRRKDGAAVIQVYPSRWDPEVIPFDDYFRTVLLLLHKLIEDEENQIHGVSILNNLEGIPFYTVFKLSQTRYVQKGMFIRLLQDAFPCRFKGIHLVNQPWYISLVLTIARPFMKQKLKDRIFIHGSDYATLFDHFDTEHLPRSLGGSAEEFDLCSGLKIFEDDLVEEANGDYPQQTLQSVD